MFKEFNVNFEDTQMIGGADNLLEGTNVTKVSIKGDCKMSSLDSFLKDCNEIDRVEGEIDFDGIVDVDNAFKNTPLMAYIDIKNVNNDRITSINTFDDIDEINVSGECTKPALQNIISSTNWNDEKVKYVNEMADTVQVKTMILNDKDSTVIEDTLEQKATGIEIQGQTYTNLISSENEVSLIDEFSVSSTDGNLSEFTPIKEQKVCVEAVEGQTYQNLLNNTKEEAWLSDTFRSTVTSDSFDSNLMDTEIIEIQGNTYQDKNNLNHIECIGELYVDEEGEPILDEEGEEQYLIEFITSNLDKSQSYKATILSPCKLMKVSNGVDRLYWDQEKGKYIVEKNVRMLDLKDGVFTSERSQNGYKLYNVRTYENSKPSGSKFINTRYKTGTSFTDNTSEWMMAMASSHLYLQMSESKGGKNPKAWFAENPTYVYYHSTIPEYVETKILEKIPSKAYDTKTYISTNTIQPSSMTITNKKYLKTPMGLLPNKEYNLQMNTIGATTDIKVNLGGTEMVIPTVEGENVKKNIVVRTPATLVNDTLELSGQGNKVSDVMLFDSKINQEPNYFDGISSVGEWDVEQQGYKIDILTADNSRTSNANILLPQQLNAIGNKKDRLYWDYDKGHYCIEQNVELQDNNIAQINKKIIDLPRLTTRYNLDMYLPTTYFEISNNIKPSKLEMKSPRLKAWNTTLEPSKKYEIQLEGIKEGVKNVRLHFGEDEYFIPSFDSSKFKKLEITPKSANNILAISNGENRIKSAMIFEDGIAQTPTHFEGTISTGELQSDGKYKIDIETSNNNDKSYKISVLTDNPLTPSDKLYFDAESKTYKVDRNGEIETPQVEGDVIDLPRLYQKEDTYININTGNIKPSQVEINYRDFKGN